MVGLVAHGVWCVVYGVLLAVVVTVAMAMSWRLGYAHGFAHVRAGFHSEFRMGIVALVLVSCFALCSPSDQRSSRDRPS